MVLLVFAGLLSGPLALPAAAANVKIATISVQDVLDKSNVVQAVRGQIEAEVEKHRAALQQKQTELDALFNEIEKKKSVWSEQVKRQRERELQRRYREFEIRNEDAQIAVRQVEQKLMDPILRELDLIIAELGKNNNYDLILEVTTKGLRSRTGLLYANEALDISNKVLRELNQRLKQ
ncbi:MAG: OmpH family outer membrane protein [Desulfobulbaceae bacterium]|nr:MAG: OmpH family outer membrane protein [Desulfobulbaceae bacterium]